jgi:hypothetical protein
MAHKVAVPFEPPMRRVVWGGKAEVAAVIVQ